MHFPRRFALLSLVMCLAAILPAIASAAPCVSGQTGPAVSQVRIFTPPNDEYCTLVDLTGCSPWVAAHWELFWPTACTIPAQAYFRAAVETPPASGCFKPGAQVGPSYNYSLVGVASSNVDHVSPAMWNYEVSGKQVIPQWFSYRKRDRARPIIGDRRKPSELGNIQPDHWLAEYTTELLNLLNVLGLLVDLEPKQAALLDRLGLELPERLRIRSPALEHASV